MYPDQIRDLDFCDTTTMGADATIQPPNKPTMEPGRSLPTRRTTRAQVKVDEDVMMTNLMRPIAPRKIKYGCSFPLGCAAQVSNLQLTYTEGINTFRERIVQRFPIEGFQRIFNESGNNGKRSKPTRSQRSLNTEDIENSKFLTALKQEFIYQAKRINPEYNTVHAMQLLFSKNGCPKQQDHTDSEVGKNDSDIDDFVSCIFTFDSKT